MTIVGRPLDPNLDWITKDDFDADTFVCIECASVSLVEVISITPRVGGTDTGEEETGWLIVFRCKLCDHEWEWFFWEEAE